MGRARSVQGASRGPSDRARRRVYILLAAALAISSMAVPAAFAAKGGNGGSSAIWIEESLTADSLTTQSADRALHHGDPVSFGFRTSYWDDVYNTGPWLRLECYLGSTLVYWENRAGFEGGYRYGEPFTLGPSLAWPSGGADCVGVLGHYHPKNSKFMVESTVDFDVMP